MKTTSRFMLGMCLLLLMCSGAAIAQPVQNGFAVGTCYSDGSSSGPVAVLIDVRLADLQTPNVHWNAPKTYGPASSPWTKANLGEVFGICFDPSGNFYVSATTVFYNTTPGGPGGSGAIYKINGASGAISTFAQLPNNGIGLGNIAWDDANNQMFATNFEDGTIYRIDASGTVSSTFDPWMPDGGTSGIAPLGELVFGIGVYENRVYFARWSESAGNQSSALSNEIWSIGLDGTGDFTGSPTLEITMPVYSGNWSNPVADIAFSAAGRMMLAERGSTINSGNIGTSPHSSRVLEYEDPGSGWVSTGNVFSIGVISAGANSNGGVDYAYDSYDAMNNALIQCDEAIWATGDGLRFDWNPNYQVYGFQRLPASGGSSPNNVMIDADGIYTMFPQDKTEIGDVEIYKVCDAPNPCDDISWELNQDPDVDGCCFDLTINGLPSNNAVTSVVGYIGTPGTVFTGVTGPSGWGVSNSGTTASWNPGTPYTGTSLSGLRFCIQSSTSPQQIAFVVTFKDGSECKVELETDCRESDPQPCAEVQDLAVRCLGDGPNGLLFDLGFTVTNLNPFSLDAHHLTVSSATAGVSVSPSSVSFSPVLSPGGTSGGLTFSLTSSSAQPGDLVCIELQLHGEKLHNGFEWSCPPETVCFYLPECVDCCDSIDISISDGSTRQVGNNGAGVSSGVTVSPKPVIKVAANVMSVERSRIWCPDPSTGSLTPVANPTSILGVITGGSVSPSMPLASGFSPATSEAIWGTVYSGVTFSGGNIALNLSFPGTTLGYRCQDTLRICVRYSFTDTSWVTCDTVVYYTLARCGRVDLAQDSDVDLPFSYQDPTVGSGVIPYGEPLYSETAEGPGLEVSMSDYAAGQLRLSHWWQDHVVVGTAKTRLTRMHVIPEAGIDISSFNEVGGERVGEIADREMVIDVDLVEGETDVFDFTLENRSAVDFFSFTVFYEYQDADDPETTLESREYVVYADVNGPDERIEVSEKDRSRTTLFKLLVGSHGSNSADWVSPACFRFTPPENVRILASGPMPDNSSAEFHVLRSMTKSQQMLLQLPSPGEYRKEAIPEQKAVELWLVLEGETDLFDLNWEALNTNGDIVGNGTVQLDATSTVRDGDGDAVAGAAIYLLETYPNPSADQVTTRFNLHQPESVTLEVYDLTGKLIRTVMENRTLSGGAHEYTINLADRPDGVYYIRMSTEHGSQTRRVVKQR